jgi:hypothetical protein
LKRDLVEDGWSEVVPWKRRRLEQGSNRRLNCRRGGGCVRCD